MGQVIWPPGGLVGLGVGPVLQIQYPEYWTGMLFIIWSVNEHDWVGVSLAEAGENAADVVMVGLATVGRLQEAPDQLEAEVMASVYLAIAALVKYVLRSALFSPIEDRVSPRLPKMLETMA